MSFFQRLLKPVPSPAPQPVGEPPPDPAELDKQIKRLAKELYRWNTLAETGSEQTRQAIEGAQSALNVLARERAASARIDIKLIRALFPVLDGVEVALGSGLAQIETLRFSAPDAAAMLSAWLDGQRLLLDRLLAILEIEGVKPIPTIGQPFNPYLHVAVKTAYDPSRALGSILSEERRGYSRGDDVLRFADVIVNKFAEPVEEAAHIAQIAFDMPAQHADSTAQTEESQIL